MASSADARVTGPAASFAPRRGWAPAASLLLVLGIGGAVSLLFATDHPGTVIVLPAIVAGAIACARWPAGAIIVMVAMSGATGTLEGEFSLPTAEIRDFLLAGLWIGVIGSQLSGRRRRGYFWPGLIGLLLYIGLTALEIMTAPSIQAGFQSFRIAVWPMTAVVLIACAGLSRESIMRVAKGVIAAGFVVGVYAVYRKVTGPSASEFAFARSAALALPPSEIRFFASFPTAQHLSLWCATLVPFVLAAALYWKGRWRTLAVATLPLLAFALFAADVRTGILGAGLGILVTLALFSFSSPVPGGRRAASLIVASGVVVALGAGAYALTVSGDQDAEARFSRILTPSQDPTVNAREDRWNRLLSDSPNYPFGHGLGTSGAVLRGNYHQLFNPDLLFIDSTYVKVAYEQGIVVMVLFCLGLLTILGGLAVHVLRTRDGESAAFASGACGCMASMALFFYSSNYIEQLQMILAWTVVGLAIAMATSSAAARHDADRTSPAL